MTERLLNQTRDPSIRGRADDTGSAPSARCAPRGRTPGLVMELLMRLLLHPAEITHMDRLSRRFVRVRLAGKAFVAAEPSPGDKFQIDVGGGDVRTYTPYGWDAAAGSTTLLAYRHGPGPGSEWVAALRPGSACRIFGPRRALRVEAAWDDRCFVFGDETSFAVGLALRAASPAASAPAFLFEVDDVGEARQVWRDVGGPEAAFVAREPGDGHMAALERHVATAENDWRPDRFVLTGRSASVRHLRRALKSRGVDPSRIKAKVHWAPGRTGLD